MKCSFTRSIAFLFVICLVFPLQAQVHFTASLNGAQEVPAVTTTATGTGSFILNADRTELAYHITVCDLSGAITAAHFHQDRIGNAGVYTTQWNGRDAANRSVASGVYFVRMEAGTVLLSQKVLLMK